MKEKINFELDYKEKSLLRLRIAKDSSLNYFLLDMLKNPANHILCDSFDEDGFMSGIKELDWYNEKEKANYKTFYNILYFHIQTIKKLAWFHWSDNNSEKESENIFLNYLSN